MTRTERRRLLDTVEALGAAERDMVLAFAEFLAQRGAPSEPEPLPEPQIIPRPERESVVGALKRLSASYPMVDKGKMLNETSALVAQHVVQGRAAEEVIDELEVLFLRQYEKLKQDHGGTA
ncbi:Crp/Fnr family transcriptional regulator [Ectothiorhodospiraceae bacterium 2226]|nr:Crp/Fnr family transcriptional regulator [Ectothiorhodospiraceae bacterium 2226]